MPEPRFAFQNALGEVGHCLTFVQIDCQKAPLPNIDVGNSWIGKRRQQDIARIGTGIRFADNAPAERGFFNPARSVGAKKSFCQFQHSGMICLQPDSPLKEL